MSDPVYLPLGEPEGRSRWEIEHDGRRFAVFVVDDGAEAPAGYVVVDALCPHRQGRLADGLIRDGAIVCPSHWYRFDLATGECRTTPDYRLVRHPVVLRDGVVCAEIAPLKHRSWSAVLRAHASGRSTG